MPDSTQVRAMTDGQPMPIDRASLVERCMGDAGFAGLILGKFQARLDEMVSAVEQAAAAGDVAAVGRAAHAIKGAAANLSAEGLRAAAGAIEAAAHSDAGPAPTADVGPLVARLRAEARRCQSYIPTLAAGLATPAAA